MSSFLWLSVKSPTNRARYCEVQELGEWKSTIESVKAGTTMDFFLYVCETSKIESWGILNVYTRQFQQFYTCIIGRFMDSRDAR